jgi:hypothetical protein
MQPQPAAKTGVRLQYRSQHSDPILERVMVGPVQKLPRAYVLHPHFAILRVGPRSPPSPGQQSLPPQ